MCVGGVVRVLCLDLSKCAADGLPPPPLPPPPSPLLVLGAKIERAK